VSLSVRFFIPLAFRRGGLGVRQNIMAPSPTLPLKEKGVEFNPNKWLRPLYSQERGVGGELWDIGRFVRAFV